MEFKMSRLENKVKNTNAYQMMAVVSL